MNFYDTREEIEKDIWDVRKIPGARITKNESDYLLNFTKIPIPFRSLAKRYLKFRITVISQGHGSHDLVSLRLFFRCHTQLIPCLTCRNLCTTPDFIPQYELEIQETKAMVQRGKDQGRSSWMEKNQTLLERYESILAVLKDGKTNNKASKKGREYVGEEPQC